MPLWYAQYDKLSKDVTGAGFVGNPLCYVDNIHGVSAIGYSTNIPSDLFRKTQQGIVYNYCYDEQSQQVVKKN